MTSIDIKAPAKVNLFLKVINRRKDSYHNISTLFERIALFDHIKLSRAPSEIRLYSDKFITKDPKKNLAYRAAELISKKTGLKGGVKINIKKRIPIGAGLGGGSSDAAAVLAGMNRLFKLALGDKELMRYGRSLGADVPFFLSGLSFALGRGKGDLIEPAGSKLSLWHLIIYPGFEVSTKETYGAFDDYSGTDLALTMAGPDAKIHLPLRRPMDFGTAESMLYNDLEKIVKAKKRVVGLILERLARALDKRFIMSGSGPSLFCLYKTKKEVARAKKRLLSAVPRRERAGWQVFAVKTASLEI